MAACVTPSLPKPTLSALESNAAYFVDAVEVVTGSEVKSKTIKGNIEAALRDLPATNSPAGFPVLLRVDITKVHDVSPAESLMIGGTNSINADFSLIHPGNDQRLYTISLDARSANYAPGGIIGLIAEATSDDEPKLAKVLLEKMRQWVLIENDVPIRANVRIRRAANENLNEVKVATTPKGEIPRSQFSKTPPAKRITLGTGETVCDISGKWDSQYYHAQGLFEDIVTIEQTGKRYRMIKSVAHPWLEAGSVWFKCTLNSKGFEVVEANFSDGWTTVPAKINKDCDTINLSTVNGSVDFFKLDKDES